MKKFFAMLLALSMIFNTSVCAFALHEDKTPGQILGTVLSVNPVYEGIVSEDLLIREIRFEDENISPSSVSDYVYSVEDAGEVIREQLKERKNPVVVYYGYGYEGKLFNDFLTAAYAHTGDPKEGDYIRFNNIGWYGQAEYTGKGVLFTYTMTYCSSAAQEKEVDKKVDSVISGLNLNGKNQYEKIKAIYDYICSNVTYDYKNLYDDNYILKFGTYAALINGTAVCQGYATLFYRLVLEAGVDARVVTGIGNGGPHAWNIAEISDLYYNLDSTWDAGMKKYSYFLTSDNNFSDHYRDDEYTTSEFNRNYPMSKTDYDPSAAVEPDIIASGYCGGESGGQNLSWIIDKNGVLTISGKGTMSNFIPEGSAKWYPYRDKIKKLVLEEGITTIGDYAFAGLYNITGTLDLPDSLISIGNSAFKGCSGLSGNLIIPDGIKNIGHFVFYGCSGLDGTLVLPENLETIGNYAFYDCCNLKGSAEFSESINGIGGYAFYGCGIDEYIFRGNEPVANAASEEMPSFDWDDKIYYPLENDGWEVSGQNWKGYEALSFGSETGKTEIISGNVAFSQAADAFWGKTVTYTASADGYVTVSLEPDNCQVDYVIKIENVTVKHFNTTKSDPCVYTAQIQSGETYSVTICTLNGLGEFAVGSVGYEIVFTPKAVVELEEEEDENLEVGENEVSIRKGADISISYSFVPEEDGIVTLNITKLIMASPNTDSTDVTDSLDSYLGRAVSVMVGNDVYCGPFSVKAGEPVYVSLYQSAEYSKKNYEWDAVLNVSFSNPGYDNLSEGENLIAVERGKTRLSESYSFVADESGTFSIEAVKISIIDNYGMRELAIEDLPQYVRIYVNGKILANTFSDSFEVTEGQEMIIVLEKSNPDHREDSFAVTVNISCGSETVYGDVDGNGVVNVMDANLLRKYSAKLVTLTAEQEVLADVDGNGKANIIDAGYIRRFAAKLISDFPIRGSNHIHSYSEWFVEEYPTCTETGILYSVCEKCGDKVTETIPASGHNYFEKVLEEATCGENGVKEYTCSVCGEAHTEDIPATEDHLFGAAKITEATCTEKGKKTYHCTNCGYSYYDEIAAKGHSWQDATCTEAKICTECGVTEGSPLGHNFEGGFCTVCDALDPDAWLSKETLFELAEELNYAIEYAVEAGNSIETALDYYKKGWTSSAVSKGRDAQGYSEYAREYIYSAYMMLGTFDASYNFDGIWISLSDCLVEAFYAFDGAAALNLDYTSNLYVEESYIYEGNVYLAAAQTIVLFMIDNGIYV